jgi:hypothetical protein
MGGRITLVCGGGSTAWGSCRGVELRQVGSGASEGGGGGGSSGGAGTGGVLRAVTARGLGGCCAVVEAWGSTAVVCSGSEAAVPRATSATAIATTAADPAARATTPRLLRYQGVQTLRAGPNCVRDIDATGGAGAASSRRGIRRAASATPHSGCAGLDHRWSSSVCDHCCRVSQSSNSPGRGSWAATLWLTRFDRPHVPLSSVPAASGSSCHDQWWGSSSRMAGPAAALEAGVSQPWA